jgi:hypothetical protein
MFDLGEIGATLTLDDQDFKKKLSGLNMSVEGSFSKINSGIKSLAATAAGLFAFSRIKNFAKDAVEIYADAHEAAQKFETVFSNFMGDDSAERAINAATAAALGLTTSAHEMQSAAFRGDAPAREIRKVTDAALEMQSAAFRGDAPAREIRKVTDAALEMQSAAFRGDAPARELDKVTAASAGAAKEADKAAQKLKGASAAFQGDDAVRELGRVAQAAREVPGVSLLVDVQASREISKAKAAAREMQENYGMSEFAAKSALSFTGDLLTGFGFSQEKALELSIQTAKLGADLAAFTNYAGGAEGAINALTKGMLGETEMMKQLGVVVRATDKDFMALVKTLMETRGVTLNEARAEATLLTAINQSKNAIGAYAREADTLSTQMKLTGQRMVDLKMKIGGFLSSLLNLEEAGQKLNNLLLEVTDALSENAAKWVYYIKTVGNAIYTGLAGGWQVLLPFLSTGFEVVGKGFRNVWELGKWTFESLGEIFANFGSIISAVFKDSTKNAMAFFSLLLESAEVTGSSLWGLLTGKLSFDDVKDKFAGLAESAVLMIGRATENTEQALRDAGVSAMPDFEFPDFEKIIAGFGGMLGKIEQENLAGLQRQERIYEEYLRAKLGLDKEEAAKSKSTAAEAREQIERGSDVTGSFSAAIVAAMVGRSKPEEETARNTRDMRLMLQRIEKKPLMTF